MPGSLPRMPATADVVPARYSGDSCSRPPPRVMFIPCMFGFVIAYAWMPAEAADEVHPVYMPVSPVERMKFVPVSPVERMPVSPVERMKFIPCTSPNRDVAEAR